MKERVRIAGFLQMKSWSSDQFCNKWTNMNKRDKILIAGALEYTNEPYAIAKIAGLGIPPIHSH